MTGADIQRVEHILQGLGGVRAVARLSPGARREVARVEAAHEAAAAVPVQNVGVRSAATRSETFVILKDARFRPPGMPTVYLVEEAEGRAPGPGEQPPDPFRLVVEGRCYKVIGQELHDGGAGSSPAGNPRPEAVYLADTFAMFPERRTGTGVPCWFLLPPIPFPELEARQQELGIARVVSVSPSLAVDMYLRELHGFDRSNELATILVGFDTVP